MTELEKTAAIKNFMVSIAKSMVQVTISCTCIDCSEVIVARHFSIMENFCVIFELNPELLKSTIVDIYEKELSNLSIKKFHSSVKA
jgi:hypothetical protein